MPQTRINCPNCRQPITAEIEQLIDVSSNPGAKQRLLSGTVNVAACPNCGYRGNLATPVVYHDADKELLLTFFPPEVGLPRNEQERMLGQLINQVVNKLPQEKRKAYLLRPQTMLTYQGLVERILEADGITREMLQASQLKMNLLQRLISAKDDVRIEILKQEDKLVDAEFFSLLSRLGEAAMASGDQQSAKKLADLQKEIVPNTTFGRQLQEQSQEVQAAIKDLQDAGQNLTREKLVDLVINAPNDLRVSALVSVARPGMDYEFFQVLSRQIDQASEEQRPRLNELRERILALIQQVDQQMAARAAQSRQILEAVLQAKDVRQATVEILPAIDEFFLNELNSAMEAAREQSDLDKIAKLNQVVEVLQQATEAPAEMGFLEDLIDAPDEAALRKLLEQNQDKVTPELLDTLNNVMAQVQNSGDAALAVHVQAIQRQVVRYSMELQMRK